MPKIQSSSRLPQMPQTLSQLQQEKATLEASLGGNLPFDALQKASTRISELIQLLDKKETRWLELSEKLV